MALAALLLLPFLHSPFTIDDPVYLYEAQHVLQDPLHPQSFDLVWSLGLHLRASQILPGGLAVPYLLVPTVLAGSAEWAGHLTQLILLLLALYSVALLALRLGLDQKQAAIAALLAASAPAVIGIAGTVMPDVAAMLFSSLGMERIVAWREERKWQQGLLATIWLTLAILTRAHTLALWPAALVFLLDGLEPKDVRSAGTGFRARFPPLIRAPGA